MISVFTIKFLTLKPEEPSRGQVTDKHYHIILYLVHLTWAGFELTTLVVIGTDCIGSCSENWVADSGCFLKGWSAMIF
jgi:hypothetical protein